MDTKAIDVQKPEVHQRRLYNGKYSGHVVKIQVTTDNRGVPIDLRGLHEGRRHDVRIWRWERRRMLLFLVDNHLLMYRTATSSNLEDPKVIGAYLGGN